MKKKILFSLILIGIICLTSETTAHATIDNKYEFNKDELYKVFESGTKTIYTEITNKKSEVKHNKDAAVSIEYEENNTKKEVTSVDKVEKNYIWMRDIILQSGNELYCYSIYFDENELPKGISLKQKWLYWNELQTLAIETYNLDNYFGSKWEELSQGNYEVTGRYNTNPFGYIDK